MRPRASNPAVCVFHRLLHLKFGHKAHGACVWHATGATRIHDRPCTIEAVLMHKTCLHECTEQDIGVRKPQQQHAP